MWVSVITCNRSAVMSMKIVRSSSESVTVPSTDIDPLEPENEMKLEDSELEEDELELDSDWDESNDRISSASRAILEM
jgi:hypothetical protein